MNKRAQPNVSVLFMYTHKCTSTSCTSKQNAVSLDFSNSYHGNKNIKVHDEKTMQVECCSSSQYRNSK